MPCPCHACVLPAREAITSRCRKRPTEKWGPARGEPQLGVKLSWVKIVEYIELKWCQVPQPSLLCRLVVGTDGKRSMGRGGKEARDAGKEARDDTHVFRTRMWTCTVQGCTSDIELSLAGKTHCASHEPQRHKPSTRAHSTVGTSTPQAVRFNGLESVSPVRSVLGLEFMVDGLGLRRSAQGSEA